MSYDGAGNILNDGVNQYLYDDEGRICAVSSGGAGEPVLTGYIYNAQGERVSKGSITAWSCDPGVKRVQADERLCCGPVWEQVTEMGMNPSGSIAWQHANVYAFGQVMATYVAKAVPVPYSSLDNPQTLNLYSYVRNNPLSSFDNDGHATIEIRYKSLGPGSTHSYIVVTDRDGSQTVFRGGPSNQIKDTTDIPYNPLTTNSNAYAAGAAKSSGLNVPTLPVNAPGFGTHLPIIPPPPSPPPPLAPPGSVAGACH